MQRVLAGLMSSLRRTLGTRLRTSWPGPNFDLILCALTTCRTCDRVAELRGLGFQIALDAEGVENLAERDVSSELDCDFLQGYFFARPGKPFPEMPAHIEDRRR